jgi:outer membrane protein assembly factor BamB
VRLNRAISAALVAALLAGCQTVGGYYNSLFGSSAPVEKPAELPSFTQTAQASVAWQARVSAANSYVFRPVVVGENVFVSGNAGDIASLDLRTGKSAWVAEAGTKLSAGVGSDGRTVVVATARGEVIALEASGRVLWKAQVSSEVLSTPVMDEGLVVVRSADGQLHGLEARDGRRRWLYQRPLPPLIMRSPAGVTVDRGGVFAGFPGGKAVAIALPTGGLGWEATVSLPKGATELERIADIVGAPAVEGSHVCAASFQGRLACFDAQRGSPVWARDLSSLVPLAIDSRYVFATDDKNAVHAFERGAGTSVWKQDKLAGRGLTGPQVFGRYVAVGDFQGYIHLLNRDDGSFAARVPTDGSAVLSQPVATKAGLLVQTRNGGIFMIAIP